MEDTSDKQIKTLKIALIVISITLIIAFFSFLKLSFTLSDFVDRMEEGYTKCDNFCLSNNQEFFLYDLDSNACQCYNLEEEPTNYANFKLEVKT